MPRPDVSMTINANCLWTRYNGAFLADTSRAHRIVIEQTSGTSRRKPQGFIPPTGYSFLQRRVTTARGYSNYFIPGGTGDGNKFSGNVGGGLNCRFDSTAHFDQCITETTLWDFQNLVNSALVQARLKLKGSKVNLGVAWAERSKTAQLLGDTTIRLAGSYRALRRGHVRQAMNLLGISNSRREPRGSNVPRKWLELQYGWKPLLADCYGAADALRKRPLSDFRVTAVGKASASGNRVLVKPVWTTGPSLHDDAGVISCQFWQGAFVRIDAIPGNEGLQALASLGVTNPLLVAWELVPLSFVVDWAFGLGDYIASLDAMVGYASAHTSTSKFAYADWTETSLSGAHPSNGRFLDAKWDGSKSWKRLLRTTSSGVPLPTLPVLKNPASLGHMANGLALLAGAFRR